MDPISIYGIVLFNFTPNLCIISGMHTTDNCADTTFFIRPSNIAYSIYQTTNMSNLQLNVNWGINSFSFYVNINGNIDSEITQLNRNQHNYFWVAVG